MTRIWILAVCLVSFCDITIAQQNDTKPEEGRTVQLPRFANTTVTTVVSVPDGGAVVFGSGIKSVGGVIPVHAAKRQRSSREILSTAANPLPAWMRNHLCSKVTVSGVTTYDIIHDFKPLIIAVHESGRIEIKVVRQYDESTLDQLEQDHPEVAMHVSAIPSASPDGARIQMSLEIETLITAESVDELEEQHPQIWQVFRQHTTPPLVILSPPLVIPPK